MYANGRGVDKDEVLALDWYKKAADQGLADAQYAMSYAYRKGAGVAPSETEALKWLRKAAEQNHPESMFHLGNAYVDGLGVDKDEMRALSWYCKAAQAGHEAAREIIDEVSVYKKIECELKDPQSPKKNGMNRNTNVP